MGWILAGVVMAGLLILSIWLLSRPSELRFCHRWRGIDDVRGDVIEAMFEGLHVYGPKIGISEAARSSAPTPFFTGTITQWDNCPSARGTSLTYTVVWGPFKLHLMTLHCERTCVLSIGGADGWLKAGDSIEAWRGVWLISKPMRLALAAKQAGDALSAKTQNVLDYTQRQWAAKLASEWLAKQTEGATNGRQSTYQDI